VLAQQEDFVRKTFGIGELGIAAQRDANIAEAEDTADDAAQHPVGAALVEFAALEVGVLDEQALRRRQRQRDDVLRPL
jgi:hypothetical protein